jgi:hypothetical protein
MAVVLPRALGAVHGNHVAADRVYRPLAAWVREHTGPDQFVFAGDIGYLGYFSNRKILDSAGLVSPEVWRYYDDNPADPLRDVHFVQQRRPALVVLSMVFGAYGQWNRREFLDTYAARRRFSMTGDNELRPSEDPARSYQADPGRTHADYIVYHRLPETP